MQENIEARRRVPTRRVKLELPSAEHPVMRRGRSKTLVAGLVAAFAIAPPAAAEIHVLNAGGAEVAFPVRDQRTVLWRWTDDGAGLLVSRAARGLVVPAAGGAAVRASGFDWATLVGPGGRSARVRGYPSAIGVHAADGSLIATFAPADVDRPRISDVAWSPDGRRAAVVVDETVHVFDADTGATIVSVAVPGIEAALSLSPQAFSPDGSALIVADQLRVTRIDVPTGDLTVLDVLPSGRWRAPAWSATGAIAVMGRDRIRLSGAPVTEISAVAINEPALWTPDGGRLTYSQWDRVQECADSRVSLRTVAPGAPARTLLMSDSEPEHWAWSPDGQRIAVQIWPDQNKRHARHPWPRRIPRSFEMVTPAGDAAVRAVIVRAAIGLRQGASRPKTMRRVRVGLDRVFRHHGEARDTAVQEAIANELGRWLHAAGFVGIDATDELDC